MSTAPTRRRPSQPFRVLCSLLYCRFLWVDRDDAGQITVPTRRFAKQLGLRTHALHECLARLAETGLIAHLTWKDDWFRVRLQCPQRAAWLVGAPPQPDPSTYPFAQAHDFARSIVDG